MQKLKIKLDSMNIAKEDIDNVINAIKMSQMSIFNSESVKVFEHNLALFLSDKNLIKTVMLPNCTSAIFIALQLLNLEKDDEIIVPNLTHPSSIYPIIYTHKCKIKVCEFNQGSYDLDLAHFKALIAPNTKAIIVCYLHGYSFNIKEIREICEQHRIKMIEDAAQGLGTQINGEMAGTIGDYGCFSFGENKLLRMGEGGALVYKKEKDRNRIDRHRHVGEVWKNSRLSTVSNNSTYGDILKNGFDYLGEGFNFRCNPLNVALGIRPLRKINQIIEQRRNKLRVYHEILKSQPGIRLINNKVEQSAPISAWFLVDSEYYEVDKIILKCIDLGIPIGKFKYPTVTKIEAFQNYIINFDDVFSNSEYVKENSLFLPLYENISLEDTAFIGNNFKELLQEYKTIKNDKKILKETINYFDGFFIK